MVADPAVGPGADEGAGDSTQAVDGLTSCDVGRGDLHGSAEPVPDENRGADAEHESDLGVTPAAPAGPAEQPKALVKEQLVVRFRKMVIGITNAPLPSGDGKVVDGLTLGDLKTPHCTGVRCASTPNTRCFSAPPPAWGPATPGRVRSFARMWRLHCVRPQVALACSCPPASGAGAC